MKVTGLVEIYDINNSSIYVTPRRGTLILGIENGEVILLHQYIGNTVGVRYKLTKNIEKLFCKFDGQGKATIRFLDPRKEVKIRGSADRLKQFMKLVKEVAEGNETNIRPIPPNSVMEIPKKTAAVISSTAELSKLPKMLVSLTVKFCDLQNLHPEIVRFEDLQILDMSCNRLVDLPLTLGRLSLLTVLVLNNNIFGCKADWKFLESRVLHDTLKVLDLQFNDITVLPNDITMFHKLEKLMLNHNKLKTLPFGIGRMGLKELGLSYNEIQYFPTTIRELVHLETLDISHNPSVQMRSVIPRFIDNNAPSLLECSLQALEYRYGIPEHFGKVFYPELTVYRMLEVEYASRTKPVEEIEASVRRLCRQVRYDTRMFNHLYYNLPINLQKLLRSAKHCLRCSKHVYERYANFFEKRPYPVVRNLVRSEDMDDNGVIYEHIYCSYMCLLRHESER